MKWSHVVRNVHMGQHAIHTHALVHTHAHTPIRWQWIMSHTASHCGRAQEETFWHNLQHSPACKDPISASISSNLEWNDSYISVCRTYKSHSRWALPYPHTNTTSICTYIRTYIHTYMHAYHTHTYIQLGKSFKKCEFMFPFHHILWEVNTWCEIVKIRDVVVSL